MHTLLTCKTSQENIGTATKDIDWLLHQSLIQKKEETLMWQVNQKTFVFSEEAKFEPGSVEFLPGWFASQREVIWCLLSMTDWLTDIWLYRDFRMSWKHPHCSRRKMWQHGWQESLRLNIMWTLYSHWLHHTSTNLLPQRSNSSRTVNKLMQMLTVGHVHFLESVWSSTGNR